VIKQDGQELPTDSPDHSCPNSPHGSGAFGGDKDDGGNGGGSAGSNGSNIDNDDDGGNNNDAKGLLATPARSSTASNSTPSSV